MLWIDIVIIGVVAISAIISLVRGFVREAFSLASWFVAVGAAWFFFRPVSVHFESMIEVPSMRLAAAFVVILIAVLILGALITRFMGMIVDSTGLSGTDRMIGVLFGAARGALIVVILVTLAGLTPLPEDPWWKDSQLIPYFQDLAVWLKSNLPEEFASYFNY